MKDVIEVVGRLTQNASYRIPSKKTEKTDAAGKVQVVKDFEWSKFLPGNKLHLFALLARFYFPLCGNFFILCCFDFSSGAPDGPFDKVVTDLFGARVVVLTK